MRFSLACLILLFLFLFQTQFLCSSSSTNHTSFAYPQCSSDESSALFQFKNSFSIDDPSYDTRKWDESTNCCGWSGVTCDNTTGHVIGLHLNNLRGAITSNSSLFSLRYLQILDLSSNDFIGSNISPNFGYFTHLTHLKLSYSNFSGLIPFEITRLPKLVSFRVGVVSDSFFIQGWGSYVNEINISAATFKALAQNSSKMRELSLIGIDLSSVPSPLTNLSSSLTYLVLSECNLYEELPANIFWLMNLRSLDLSGNQIVGSFPKSNWTTPLQRLDLSDTKFSVHLSHLLKNTRSLSYLRLHNSHFVEPFSLFYTNFSRLETLILSNNSFSGQIPWSSLNLLENLVFLDLSSNNFVGELPKFNINSSHNFSSFDKTKFMVGQIPSKLQYIRLSNNLLNGTVPAWIYSRPNLRGLDLSSNSFTGEIGVEELSKSTDLRILQLSYNNLWLRFNQSVNHRFDSLWYLELSSCNISEFPNFIKSSESLDILNLSQNQLHGSVPKWLGDFSQLGWLNLSHNFLTSIEPLPRINNLHTLDLRSNFFSGPLPIISSLMQIFSVSKNQFSGEIPNSICGLTSLKLLDFSFNNLSGEIPQCMGNFSQELSVFDLRNNKLKGTIPTTFSLIGLRTLNLNGNQLEGQLPTSLENCTNLEVLDLGNNLFQGTFPSHLEFLPELKVLVLRSNKFRGSIQNPRTKSHFQKLRIVDLSDNEFTGSLPRKLFENFEPMKNSSEEKMGYMGNNYYHDSVRVTLKGSYIELQKILTIFATIDFSRNNFSGEIPESIGRLKALKGLNFSYNKLTGAIPRSLRNLTNLEWLDLSSNELVGEIPVDLADITSLALLNLSHNHLQGPIPQGKQFNTFSNDSYIGNLGLYGCPMTEKCIKDSDVESMYPSRNQDVESNWFDGKTVAMGYASGLVIGISLGYMLLYSNGRLSWMCEKMIFRILKR